MTLQSAFMNTATGRVEWHTEAEVRGGFDHLRRLSYRLRRCSDCHREFDLSDRAENDASRTHACPPGVCRVCHGDGTVYYRALRKRDVCDRCMGRRIITTTEKEPTQ